MKELHQLFNVIETFLTCELCTHIMMVKEGPTGHPLMVLPCMHSFCGDCHAGKRKCIDECTHCGEEEEQVVNNLFIAELGARYRKFKAPLEKKMRWMQARMDKNFAV